MPTRIDGTDPDGAGTNEVKVNKEGQLLAQSTTQSELEHESEENGAGYNWSSKSISIDAADTILLVKNTSDTPLHIECIKVSNGATTTEAIIHLPTTEVTVTGTTVTGTNLNTGSSNVAEATAASDDTDNAQGNIIRTVFMAADSNHSEETPGLILGKNKSVAIDTVNTENRIAATIIGHYAD